MHVEPIITALEARVRTQAGLMSGPDAESTVGLMLEILRPAVQQAAIDIADQAAAEIRAQLPDHVVDLGLVDGEPTIQIRDAEPGKRSADEEFDARISLRLPPTLKDAIETFATDNGESVNAWVVKTLEGKAQRRPRGGRVNTSFEL